MSFIRDAFSSQPLHTVEEYMQCFIDVAQEVGMPDVRAAAILAAMCAFQEAGADLEDGRGRQIWCPGNDGDPCFRDDPRAYPHDSMGDDGMSTGSFQQQMNQPGRTPWGWGGVYGDPEGTRKRMDMRESTRMFYSWPGSGLKFKAPDASNASRANDSVQRVQGSGVPGAYAQWYQMAVDLYERVSKHNPANAQEDKVGFSGDPVWLEDVLREALGDRLVVEPGWAERGTGGTMGDIWGVLIHHTGNSRETVEGIRDGRSDLAGPLSQCLITPDGKCHLIAVGPCNHAGIGNYPGIGINNGNQRLIGFECAWPDIRPDGSYDPGQRWPDPQIITMRDASAAVLKRLGADQTHVIGHKDWARVAPNVKWDPGNFDMKWFQGEVGKDLAGFVFPGEQAAPAPVEPPAPQLPTTPPPVPDEVIYDQTSARWEQLGWRTPVEALAVILDAVLKVDNTGTTGMTRAPHPIQDRPRAE